MWQLPLGNPEKVPGSTESPLSSSQASGIYRTAIAFEFLSAKKAPGKICEIFEWIKNKVDEEARRWGRVCLASTRSFLLQSWFTGKVSDNGTNFETGHLLKQEMYDIFRFQSALGEVGRKIHAANLFTIAFSPACTASSVGFSRNGEANQQGGRRASSSQWEEWKYQRIFSTPGDIFWDWTPPPLPYYNPKRDGHEAWSHLGSLLPRHWG